MQTIIAVVGLLLSGGVFFFYTKPTYDASLSVKAEIAQYDEVLDRIAEFRKLRDELSSRFNAYTDVDKDRLKKMLPDHVDNVRLILDLDNLAARHGIALQNVDVTSSASRAAEKQAVAIEIGSSDQKYDSLTFAFGTTATYPTFVAFLHDLESSLRIVDLTSLTMDPAGESVFGPQGIEPKYSFKVVLRTYWLK